MLPITPLTSHHLRGYHYDPSTSTLSVFTHKSPFLYTHTGVPSDVIQGFEYWVEAGYSPGAFYHSHLKHYPLAPSVLKK